MRGASATTKRDQDGPSPRRHDMRCYSGQHRFYVGVDLHARTMYIHVLDHTGKTVFDKNLPADPQAFLEAIAPFRPNLVVGCECVGASPGAPPGPTEFSRRPTRGRYGSTRTSIARPVRQDNWFGCSGRLSAGRGLTREQVRPPARVFHVRVGMPLDHIHGDEPRQDELARDLLWGEEGEA